MQRPPRYISKHNGRTAPTGSTFNIRHTSRPDVSNLGNTVSVVLLRQICAHLCTRAAAHSAEFLSVAKAMHKSDEHVVVHDVIDCAQKTENSRRRVILLQVASLCVTITDSISTIRHGEISAIFRRRVCQIRVCF